MRIISVVACVALSGAAVLAGTGSALAADCNKGMLWPFVRTTGDCLTDVEIASGKTGVYSGPVNTNVDVSAIKPTDPVVQNTGTSGGGSNGSGLLGNGGALVSTSVFGAEPKGRADTDAGCTKGVLWPFSREPGDCLTADEKKAGKTGVYGGGAGVVPVSATAPASGTTAAQPPASAPAPAAVKCQRGWFWPFVRESNDCPTEADKNTGKTSLNVGGSGMTQVSAVTMPAAQVPVAAAPAPPVRVATAPAPSQAATTTCEKGLLWPFVRESNDCPTDTDKKTGKIGPNVGDSGVTQVSAVNTPSAQTAAAPAPSQAATTTCQRGLLWPFVRESNDCPTDTDKKNGK